VVSESSAHRRRRRNPENPEREPYAGSQAKRHKNRSKPLECCVSCQLMEGTPPPQPPPTAFGTAATGASVSFSDAETHYTILLAYFKDLVRWTGAALGLILAAGSLLFYSNLKDVRQDAMEQAQRVATEESREAVKKAFDEEHVKRLVEDVAKEKITAVTR
jgi:hypothetical protein